MGCLAERLALVGVGDPMKEYLAKLEAQTNSPEWDGATPPKALWERTASLIETALKEVGGTPAPHVAPHVDGVIILVWGSMNASVKVEVRGAEVAWNILDRDFVVQNVGKSYKDSDVIDILKAVFDGKAARRSLLPGGIGEKLVEK
jgi:hypothetical protein